MKRARAHLAGNLRVHVLPVLVWLAAIAGMVVLFSHRSQRFEVLGLAQGRVRQIAATCRGRLKSIPVQLFEKVNQGDTVAVIDTIPDDEHIQAELNTVSAEIEHLQAELVSTHDGFLADQDRLLVEAAERETDWVAAQRRFFVDVENAGLRTLELNTLLETDRIMLEELTLNIKIFITQGLLERDDAAPYELQKMRVEYDTLAKKIEANQQLLEQTKLDLDTAQRRCSEFTQRQPLHLSVDDALVDNALEVIRKAIKVQERRIEELLARRVALVLKSPFDGVVSQIQRRPGETVLPGEPILTIAETGPSEIVAYASEEQMGQVRENMVVELIKTNEPAQVANSQVIYIGPAMEAMPAQLRQNPNIPQWGRPILIKVPPGLKLIPGELVGIRGL